MLILGCNPLVEVELPVKRANKLDGTEANPKVVVSVGSRVVLCLTDGDTLLIPAMVETIEACPDV